VSKPLRELKPCRFREELQALNNGKKTHHYPPPPAFFQFFFPFLPFFFLLLLFTTFYNHACLLIDDDPNDALLHPKAKEIDDRWLWLIMNYYLVGAYCWCCY